MANTSVTKVSRTPRDEARVRDAKIREAVRGVLSDGEEYTASRLMEILTPDLEALGFKPANLRFILYEMAESKLIHSRKEARTLHFSAHASAQAKVPESEPKRQKTKPAVKIDIVKSTGKVRIELDGLLIEIGVV